MAGLAERLKGPVLVLGHSGFIGKHLVAMLRRAEAPEIILPPRGEEEAFITNHKPAAVFNCAAYGAKREETDEDKMVEANVTLVRRALDATFDWNPSATFIHVGTASEYGRAVPFPSADTPLKPVTPYAETKVAGGVAVNSYGRSLGYRTATLRLYHVYGPDDRAGTLTSRIVEQGDKGFHVDYANPLTTRSFLYVEDACRAMLLAALALAPEDYGRAFDIAGENATLEHAATAAGEVFGLTDLPVFDYTEPLEIWSADGSAARKAFGYMPKVPLEEGLRRMAGE